MRTNDNTDTTLVLGASGKSGRRVAQQLIDRGLPVRLGSRTGTPPFDWNDRSTWAPVLEGISRVYISYYPDVAVPGAAIFEASGSKMAKKCGRSCSTSATSPVRLATIRRCYHSNRSTPSFTSLATGCIRCSPISSIGALRM